MTNDIVALIDYYEKEKGIDRQKVIEALENAFITACRRMVPATEGTENLRADVNVRKGETRIYATLVAVPDEELTDKYNQVPLSVARKRDPEAEPGQEIEFDVTPKDFGRIAVQTAKQTMMQRLRQAEKEMIYEEFKDRAGDIVSGTVRRFDRSDVLVDLGKFEGGMPARERVATEEYNIGDRIRAYVVAVENEGRGPEIILSRSHPNFVRRLFEAEVSEISDHTVEIRGIAREAGYRTKVAVYSNDPKVDPVGACVGLRGARVKNIVRELNNEKVDIIRWSDDLEEFVTDALKPATRKSVSIDEENHVINVTVEEEDLSKAIGRRGQNARLSSRLLGWDVQVRKDESEAEKFQTKISDAAQHLVEGLAITPEVAEQLLKAGGMTLDLVVQMDAQYVAGATGLDESEAAAVLERAREALGNPAAEPEESETTEETPEPEETTAEESEPSETDTEPAPAAAENAEASEPESEATDEPEAPAAETTPETETLPDEDESREAASPEEVPDAPAGETANSESAGSPEKENTGSEATA